MLNLDNVPNHKRAAVKAQVLASCPIPQSFVYSGNKITVLKMDYDPLTQHLVIIAKAKRGGKSLFKPFEEFRFQNPPILVPDGTTRLIEDCGCENHEVNNYKEDLNEAIKIMLGDAVEIARKHV